MSTPAASDTSVPASFDLLGPVVATVAGQPAPLGGPRQVAVLARLLLSPGQVVSMEQLSESIWDGDSPARPEVAIRSYISNLRRSIEPHRHAGDRRSCIEAVPPGYRLVVSPEQIDAHRFEELVKAARRQLGVGDLLATAATLERARSLWRGEPGAGLVETDVVMAFRARLSELRQMSAELWFDARLGLAEHETVLPDLEAAVAEHPRRERLTELAMLALYRAGRQSEALAAGQRLRLLLRDQLGIDPGPAIQALEHKILNHDQSLLVPMVAPPAGPARPRTTGPRSRPVDPSGSPSSPRADPVPDRPGPGPGTPARAEVIVGRTRELGLLDGLRVSLGLGRGASVLVTGEPGVGKSTLVARLAEGLTGDGVSVVWGRCRAVAHEQVLWPWTQLLEGLRDLVDEVILNGLTGLASLAPALVGTAGAAGPGDPPAPAGPAPATAAQATVLFPAVTELLRRISATRPLVVVLDDAHWADEASVELLAFAGPALAQHPVGFVVVWRHTEVEPSSTRRALRDLARMPALTRVEVAGLSPDAIEELLAPATSDRAALARALHHLTSGNPYLVRELVAGLPPDGPGGPGTGRRTEAELVTALLQLAPSTNTQELMLHRVERAHPHALAALTVGALCPRSFTAELVAEVVGCAQTEAEEALDRAVAAGLLAEDEPEGRRYRFVHPVAARALIAVLPGPRRARFHAAVGHALWRSGAEPVDLAFHFSRARSSGTTLLAARFALESVARASRPEVVIQAELLAQEGLELVGPMAGTGALEVELASFLVHVARLRGDPARALTLAERALAVAEGAGGAELRALAALAVTGPHPTGPSFTALGWSGTDPDPAWARQIVGSTVAQVGLDHRWGPLLAQRWHRLNGQQPETDPRPPEAADRWAHWRERALAALERGTGAERRALAADGLPPNDPGPGIHDQLLAVRLELASSPPALCSLTLTAVPPPPATGSERREPDDTTSLAGLDRALTMTVHAIVRGRLDEADAILAGQTNWWARSGLVSAGALDHQRWWLRWEQGRFDDLAALTGRGAEATAGAAVGWAAVAAVEAGQPERAGRALEVMLSPPVPGRDPGTVIEQCLVALVAHRLGHRPAAGQALAGLLPWRATVAVAQAGLVLPGPVSYFAALAATTSGQDDLAVDLGAEAEELARRMEAPGWLVRALVAQAERAAQSHEWARSERLLAAAKDVAAEHRIGWLDGWLSRPGPQSRSNPFATP